ncbi:MAG: amino acid adenylation domain-containing protein [Cyanosarcina radialis HA8281-LM2]|jgi:amino acid adenylation domain-containing protein|nr:amino acid adenylation domain-containing protein [Cyanosarcina radialis HA8281-LM2]
MKDIQNLTRSAEDKQKLLAYMLAEEDINIARENAITRRDNWQKSPLSFAQESLWFLEQLNSQNAAYNIPIALRIKGRLEVAVLEKCLNEILQRHETLRSKFIAPEGQAVEIVFSEVNLPVDSIDLENCVIEERESLIVQLTAEEARTPFNLTEDVLIRVKLLRLSIEEHILLLTMHHAIADGWSLGILVQELATLYEAFATGKPSPLSPLPIQYGDFALWQRQQMPGEILETQLEYWKQNLSGSIPVIDLPADRPRPAKQTFRGAKRSLNLSKSLLQDLKVLSQQQEVTLFMTLLTAFKVLLYRYTGQEDILVGSPVAGRDRLETENPIGFFANMLVLRTNLSGNPTFRDCLVRVRDGVLAAYNHQQVPFGKLVETLQPERGLSYSPLFQVMFALQNTPMPSLKFSGLTLTPLTVDNGTAKFDLTLDLSATPNGIDGFIEYSTDLFDGETIARMVGHLQTLLEAIVANRDRQLSDLPLLTPTEQHQILVGWNDTQVDYPVELCLHHLFEAQVQRSPDAVAVVFEDRQLTYRQLDRKADRLARYLQKLGVKPEVRVGICAERSLDLVIGILGILKAGGAYVPLEPNYPQERSSFLLQDAEVQVLLTQERLKDKLPAYRGQIVCLDSDWEQIDRESEDNLNSKVRSSDCAYIIYTSGSTGQPKGVVIEHRSTVAFINWATNTFTAEDLASVLASTSICFDLSVFELFVPLSSGGRVVLVENVLALPNLPPERELTLINTVPSAIAELLEAKGIPDSVRTINLAGEALPKKLVRQLYEQTNAQQVFNLYGPSEDTTYSTFTLVKPEDAVVSIGHPIANTQVYILDRNLKPVPVGVRGELYISGEGLARGYLNQPHLTSQKFISNPFSRDSNSRLYQTGDLARYLPNGEIEYLGRLDHQVKIRGFRIELGEIETVLSQHPQIRSAVAIAQLDDANRQRLVAYVVPQLAGDKGDKGDMKATLSSLPSSPSSPSSAQLRSYLKQRLPEYMVPSTFVMLDSLPLTANGKIDRRALHLSDWSRLNLETAFVEARNPLEASLVEIWTEVLEIDRVGIYDNFFELGGHSLLSVQIVSRIRDTFGIELSLRSLFEANTIADLAAIIAQKQIELADNKLLAEMLTELERLSPEEVQKMLAQLT